MATLINVFVGLHILGIAALLGGFLFQVKAMRSGEVRVLPGMLHGALTMLVTGVAMLGVKGVDGTAVNGPKIILKLTLLMVVLGLVYVMRDEEKLPTRIFAVIGGLTTVNVFIAVLWT